MLVVPLALLYGYERYVASHAEWHWASRITTLHVIPAFKASVTSAHALHVKADQFRAVLGMLGTTMVGPALSAAAILGFLLMPTVKRSRTLLWAWLAGGLAYIYVVVTVERVDYYMYLMLPLAALTGAGFLLRLCQAVAAGAISNGIKYAAVLLGLTALASVVYQNRAIVRPYYRYNKQVYRNAVALDKTLAPDSLIVMGHYDPSILYYIGRYGWEEDPYLWTPFDEQSAIRKGARYFIDIEKNRFAKNVELCAWMQRFPIINAKAQWPVYVTDPARVKPGAEKEWRSFRDAERAGHARTWLDSRGYCKA
jgi:hypothetical protein